MADNKGGPSTLANRRSPGANSGDEEEEESGITLVDVVEEEEQLEEDANAVLGASDADNCTYTAGYVKRQALYACVTCLPSSSGELAGICLACSYHCHDGHELIELYTKRNFRCDCGNSKLRANACTLYSNKDSINNKNHYNHNFKGLYCTCRKPYPDPDDSQPDEMAQCVLCEDWFHFKHLGQACPSEPYSEMTCDSCMAQHPRLGAYVGRDGVGDGPAGCKLAGWNDKQDAKAKATYWPERWRDGLCRCPACLEAYREEKIDFLIDDQDTVESYEEKGKATKRPSHNDRLMMALSSLDRVQQIEAIHEYQSFSSELKEYLKKFAENKKVVRAEDIHEFFGQLKQRKRQRTAFSNFCH